MIALRVLSGEIVIWRADASVPIDVAVMGGVLVSVTRTAAELSGVCDASSVPRLATRVERGWAVLEVVGPLDFSLTGVLASITRPLADAGVTIFAVSTFDTDYVLVRREALVDAVTALREAGHDVDG